MTQDTDRLRQQLNQLDPAPFVGLLLQVLQNAPSPEDLAKFAKDHPDKFVKMTKQLASVVGYSEKLAVAHSHRHHVVLEDMNDMELLALARAQRRALPLHILEAELADYAEAVEEKSKGGGPDAGDLRRLRLVPPPEEK